MSDWMNSPFATEQLDELAAGRLPRRIDPAAHGFAGSPARSEALTSVTVGLYAFWDQLAVAQAREVGLMVQQSKLVDGVLLIMAQDHASALVARTSGDASVQPISDDPTAVVLQLRKEGRGWVFGPGGALELVATGGEIEWRLLRAKPSTPAGLELQAPANLIAQAQAAGDAWLGEHLTARLASPEGWAQAIAAGEFHRLRAESPARRAEIVRALLEGREDPRASLIAHWARTLTPEQRRWLGDRALAEVRALQNAYEDLHEAGDFGSEPWSRALAQACVSRDELESVRVVLREAGAEEALLALRPLDAAWSRFLQSLSRGLRPSGNEQLQRARRIAPEAWWGTPA